MYFHLEKQLLFGLYLSVKDIALKKEKIYESGT